MAEEIDIGNVGGATGVASEATLARLTVSIEAMAKKAGIDPKAEAAKIQKMHNDATKSSIPVTKALTEAFKADADATKKKTNATLAFTKAIKGAALGALGGVSAGLVGLAKEVLGSSTELSSFAQHVPLVGNMLSLLTGIIDSNLSAFRDLSRVGATFGDGLNDIRATAAAANIPFSDFVALIGSSSQQMQVFGADTAAGAKNFALMSKNLRQVAGKDLMGLGFTSNDLNELLIDYATFTDRQIGVDRRNNKINTASAAEFGERLQELAGLTGKQRDEIMKQMEAAQQETRVRAAMSTMAPKEREAFLANIGSAPEAFQDVLKDMADGIPHSEAAQGMMAMSEEFRANADKIKDMNPQEMNNFMARVNRDLEQKIKEFGPGAIESIAAGGDGVGAALANIAPSLALKTEMTDEEYKTYKENLDSEKNAGASLKTFMEEINKLRSSLISAFIDSGVLETIQSFATDAVDSFGKFMKSDDFKNGMKSLTDSLRFGVEKIKTLFSDIGKYDLKTAIFGGKKGTKLSDGTELEEDVAGLFGFAGDGGIGKLIADSLGGIVSGLFGNISIPWDMVITGGIAALGVLLFAPILGIPGMIAAAVLAMFGLSKVKDMFAATVTGIKNLGTSIKDTFTWDNFKAGYDSAVSGIKSIGTSVADTFTWDNLKANYDTMVTSITDLGNSIAGVFGYDSFSSAYDDVLTKGKALGDSIASALGFSNMSDAFDSAVTVAKNLGNSIADKLGFDKQKTIFENVVTTASNLGNSIAEKLGFDKQKTIFENVMTTATDLGTSIAATLGLDNFTFPNISDLWEDIVSSVKGWFSFDLKLPNFRDFLPTWLGGKGKSVDDSVNLSNAGSPQSSANEISNKDVAGSIDSANTLTNAKAAINTIIDVPNLKNALTAIRDGMNTTQVKTYADALGEVAEQLREINEAAKDQETSITGKRGTRTVTQKSAAAGMLDSVAANAGQNTGGIQMAQLNTTMNRVVALLEDQYKQDGEILSATKNNSQNVAVALGN